MVYLLITGNQALDVSKTLTKLGLTRYDVEIVVEIEMEDGQPPSDEERASVPTPVITGPFFADTVLKQSLDDPSTKENPNGDTAQLQQRLKELGYYKGELDGWFGEATGAAVRAYQSAYGLTADAVAGPVTKAHLIQPMNDGHSRGTDEEHASLLTLPPKDGSSATYFVDVSPGYLDRDAFLAEVDTAFAVWAAVEPTLKFERTDDETKATLKVNFTLEITNRFDFKFQQSDGIGGKLAEASSAGVSFDRAERWLLQGQEPRPKTVCFEFLPVCIHELGHVFGLEHSTSPDDVMYLYYKAGATKLSESDISAVRGIIGDATAAGSAAVPQVEIGGLEAASGEAASASGGTKAIQKKVSMAPVDRGTVSWRAPPKKSEPLASTLRQAPPPKPIEKKVSMVAVDRGAVSWRPPPDKVGAPQTKGASEPKSSFCALL